jgi:glycosyltransferase involved in cell wall biosynthesis
MGARDKRNGLTEPRRLRVLRIIGRLNMGGPAHQAAYLSGRRFDTERYESLLVHGSIPIGEASLADLAEEEGARMRFVPELRQSVHLASDLRALLKLTRIVREYRPDIVHTHTAKAGFLGRLAALAVRPRPAIVHTYHGHVLEGYFGPAKSRLYLYLERSLARISDRLIGVSQATVDDLVRLGVASPNRFSVIRLGLDLAPLEAPGARLRTETRAELGLGDDEVLLVFVGRVVPIKRLDLLLRALASARSAEPRLSLAIVGDGDIRSQLEVQAAQLGLGGWVRFLGYRRELQPVFAAADVAVLSSDNEGTPVSLIEAAAAKVPAVSTEIGGVAEVVGNGESGLLVPKGDVDSLASAMVKIARDGELRERFGRAAQSRALERYGVARLLGDIDDLYRELTGAVESTISS